jgi:hypothetical protein
MITIVKASKEVSEGDFNVDEKLIYQHHFGLLQLEKL